MNHHPMHNVEDNDVPIHKDAHTTFVIALSEGNTLRETYEYEYLDVDVYPDGRLDVFPRFRDTVRASPAETQRGRNWNYASTKITDLSEIPVETRRDIQRAWELYVDRLAQVRDLAIFGDLTD